MTRTRVIVTVLTLVVAATSTACSAADPTLAAPTEGSATMERTQGAPHGLPTDDPTAARAEIRRRMVAEWNGLLADIPTAHVNSQFTVDGDQTPVPMLAVKFPSAPESEWEQRNSEVVHALHAHGWTAGPDRGFVEYDKGEYRMLGGCTVEGCWWEMRTAPLPPIIDTAESEFDLPDLQGRSSSATPLLNQSPTDR